jgi:hypothetical protein
VLRTKIRALLLTSLSIHYSLSSNHLAQFLIPSNGRSFSPLHIQFISWAIPASYKVQAE